MKRASSDRYVPALGFHGLTRYYDAVVSVTTRERTFKQALIGQADFKPGQRVLDLGCGTGTLAVWIKQSQPQAHVTGVDGDEAILARAAHKAQKVGAAVRFDHALSYALPYPGGQFDT